MTFAIQSGPKPPSLRQPKYPQFLLMKRSQWFLVPETDRIEAKRVQKQLSRLCKYYRDRSDGERDFTTSVTAEGVVVERVQ